MFQKLILVSMVSFLLLIAVFFPPSFFAQPGHNLIIMNEDRTPVELQPGDVINLSGGIATVTGATTIWGHSAMYLGLVDGEKKFLDFTTPKKEHTNENDLYQGRILNLKEFLSENQSHKEFNVFRFLNISTTTIIEVDQPILVAKAKKIAQKEKWTPINNCARVVAKVLSAATKGRKFNVRAPDGFDNASEFYQPAPGKVNIKAALKNLEQVPAAPTDLTVNPASN